MGLGRWFRRRYPQHKEAYYAVRRTCLNTWWFFRYDLHQGIAKLWIWFPIIWKDRDWDWCYLAEIMEFKLRQMHKSTKWWSHVGDARCRRDLAICAHILKRLREDEYDPYIVGYTPQVMTRKSAERARDQMLEEKKLLFKIMERRMQSWWD